MRPGRLTPENPEHSPRRCGPPLRFNAAGAINPGKPILRGSPILRISRFNEAGAINPGKPPRDRDSPLGARTGFNEAGAINPGKPAIKPQGD